MLVIMEGKGEFSFLLGVLHVLGQILSGISVNLPAGVLFDRFRHEILRIE